MESGQRVTSLPMTPAPPAAREAPNTARDVASFVGEVVAKVMSPADALNLGLAKSTYAIVQALPKFPAARLFVDLVFGWPHAHAHPPNLIPPVPPIPLPSIGPVICAGAVSVLINGMPSARCGDVGFGVWCGGFFPLFEVQTGSSHVFIGGARPARMLIDFTRHCVPGVPGLGKLGAAMMAFSAGMSGLQIASSLTDMSNADAAADSAESAAEAAAASASASAAAVGAGVAALQMAADLAAAALQAGMGKDPAIPPGLPFGNFLTGSPNVLIGGFPMPGWMTVFRGLARLLQKGVGRSARPWAQRLNQGLCHFTGHPVDIATGRVVTSTADFKLPGRIPIEFDRAYDSAAIDYTGSLGSGWIHPYDVHLWLDTEQNLLSLRDEELNVVYFDPVEIGRKSFNPMTRAWLERTDEHCYLLRRIDGLSYRFSAVESPGENPSELGVSETAALRLTSIEDSNQNRVSLFYELGLLREIETSSQDRIVFNYLELTDGRIRLADVRRLLDRASNRTAHLVRYTYDDEGRLTHATDRGLVPWRYAYQHRLLIRETNRNGLSFHFSYDGEGAEARCVHTWGDRGVYERRLTYDVRNRVTIVENSLHQKTNYYFDERGLLISSVDALNGIKRFSYSPEGYLLGETDELARTTRYTYNQFGDCLSVVHPDGATLQFTYTNDSLPHMLIDEMGAVFVREYDDRGNVISTVDPRGAKHEYQFNDLGDLIESKDPVGGVNKYTWNENGDIVEFSSQARPLTRYTYDDWGRLTSVITQLGQTTRYSYNAQDLITQIERPDGSKQHYEYDPEGNLLIFKNALGAETRYKYGDFNKLGERIDALGHTRRFFYDAEANLIEIHNERGEAYKCAYDALNRITGEVGFDKLSWKYEYDPAGQVAALTDPANRSTFFQRDARGRVIEKQRPGESAIRFDYDLNGRLKTAFAPNSDLRFEYDASGNILSEVQNGNVIQHEYDELDRRVRRRSHSGNVVKYSYDKEGFLSQLQTPRGSIAFSYDPAGRLIRRQSPGGMEEALHYDECDRLIEQSLQSRQGLLFSRNYQYDAEGNLTELRDSNKGVKRFVYDPIERIREVRRSDHEAERYVYDATGNLLQRGARNFTYDAPDRLTRSHDAALSYDQVGNLIEKRRSDSAIRYEYDSESQLLSVESNVSGRVEFAYDPLGRRISKKSDHGDVKYIWDGEVLLSEEWDGGGKEYGFDEESFEPLWALDGDDLEIYHTDYLGTVQEATNERHQVSWSADYDPYGQIRRLPFGDLADQSFRLQGHYDDPETGLYYNFFRYYDPELGRYITQDPIGVNGGINLYQYTHNPLNWIDPFGLRNLYRRRNGQFGKKPGPKPRPSTHGNAISNRPAILYALYDENDVFQKWGITQEVKNPRRRYGQSIPEGWYLDRVDRGTRRRMLALERELVETSPGPKNKEKFAGRRLGATDVSARAKRAKAQRDGCA